MSTKHTDFVKKICVGKMLDNEYSADKRMSSMLEQQEEEPKLRKELRERYTEVFENSW